MNTEQDINLRLKTLTKSVDEFCLFFRQSLDFKYLIYTHWTAKDILGHITFWHKSFAKNLKDLASGIKPSPLKGKLSEVNQMSVETTQNISIVSLIKRIQKAQNTIEKHIKNTSIEFIPYKKGSRDYSRLEHLQIVDGHIIQHLNNLKKEWGTILSTAYSK